MSNSESLGGIFGSLIVIGASLWGVKKIGEAFSSKNKENFLDNTEPL